MAAEPRVSPAALERFVADLFEALGCSAEEAGDVAGQLVLSNLVGHDSHGVGLVPVYVRMIEEGKVTPGKRPLVVSRSGSILVMDADWGVGPTACRVAVDEAIGVAKESGVAVLALRNSHHIGRIGHWAERCADQGLVSIFFVNVLGTRAAVAPFGGSDGRMLTNPFCIGVPGGERGHMIYDVATSIVALGKVRVALDKGEETPDGWLVAQGGAPTRDPAVMWTEPYGALHPFGAHKGYGLALAIELLAGALTGGGGMTEARQRWDLPTNNALAIVLDPARLGDAEGWRAEMAATIAWVTASPPAPGVEAVLVPGDPERRTATQRAGGLTLEPAVRTALVDIAARLGVPTPAGV
jgi:uncharacterized oxidoreductase